MTLQIIYVVIILSSQFFYVVAQNSTNESCGIQTTENPYPWLVGIEFVGAEEGFFILQCSGALINRRHVVSTAQCFEVFGMAKSVLFGPNITLNGRTCTAESRDRGCMDYQDQRVPIETVITHPEFTGDTENSEKNSYDVAVVKLRDIITYTSTIQPICLPSIDIDQSADRDLRIAGVYFDIPASYTRKNLGEPMTYLTREEYQSRGNLQFIAKDQIGANFIKKPKTTFIPCMLPGGLLLNKRNEGYELVGLMDYTVSCLRPKRFTHFYLYVDWIKSITPDWTPCGRRRVETVELIVNGEDTKAGDWPWHAAIFRTLKSKTSYICGGTLITKTLILTAAHCTTINGEPVSPKILTVILGKYYLKGASSETQEKEVDSVIVHENFAPRNHLANDISLLKLRTEVVYTDYVQPACIWYREDFDRLPINSSLGMVVGWGVNQLDALSSSLKQTKLPKVPDSTCIQKNPLFYSNALSNSKKFCAGWANGTSPCNGDSGGGYLVFIPDKARDSSPDAMGSWYVRGVVSLTASLKNHARCDPYQYVVFTDVEKYNDWIKKYLEN